MASSCAIYRLPDEVLEKIPIEDSQDLQALIRTSKRFHNIFVSELYESFEHEFQATASLTTARPLPFNRVRVLNNASLQRVQKFMWTILTTPALAKHVKVLMLKKDWTSDLMAQPGPDEHDAVFQGVRDRLDAETDQGSDEANLILRHLPNLQHLVLDLDMHTVCRLEVLAQSKLRYIQLEQLYGLSTNTVATLLSIPTLDRIFLSTDVWLQDDPLTELPDRSSKVQFLALTGSNSLRHCGVPPDIFQQICSKVKALVGLLISRPWPQTCACDGGSPCHRRALHNRALEDAIWPLRGSLRALVLQILPMRSPNISNDVLGRLHHFDRLETLSIAPEMILGEPGYEHLFHFSYANSRAPGFLSERLPRSMRKLTLLADMDRFSRSYTYWLDIVFDVLRGRTRLQRLQYIGIQRMLCRDQWITCRRCILAVNPGTGNAHGICDLCAESDVSEAMEHACKKARIVLTGPWKKVLPKLKWLVE